MSLDINLDNLNISPLITPESYDYSVNNRPITGQDRAFLVLGRALENVDPELLNGANPYAPIVRDPRDPSGPLLTINEFAAQLEAEFDVSPGDWPGPNTPYTAGNGSQFSLDNINALIQSLGDQLAGTDDAIPFNFIRPDTYVVLGDESAADIAFRFGVSASAVEDAVSDIDSGTIINLGAASLDGTRLTSDERDARAFALLDNLVDRLKVLHARTGESGYSAGYATDIWRTGESSQSFRDFLNNHLNPQLEQLTGKTLEETILPYGLGSLFSTAEGTDGKFTPESINDLAAAIGRFSAAEHPERSREALISEFDIFRREVNQLSNHPFFTPSNSQYEGPGFEINANGERNSLRDVIRATTPSDSTINTFLDEFDLRIRSLTGQTGEDFLAEQGINSYYTSENRVSQAHLQALGNAATAVIFDTQTPAERSDTVRSALVDVTERLNQFRSKPELDDGGTTGTGYVSGIYEDEDGNDRSLAQYLAAEVDPILVAQTGRTFVELVADNGYQWPSSYSHTSIDTTVEVVNSFIEAKFTNTAATQPPAGDDEYVTAVAGNITRGANGAYFVNGEQRSVIRIAAEIRLASIDDEAARSAELLQALNERVEQSALGTEILDLLAQLPKDTDGNYTAAQSSLWARGDNAGGSSTLTQGLRALAEEYNVDDPFAAFLPNYELADARSYSPEDLQALERAIGAFQDTATRDNERDNLAIQESHTKLNVLLENLNAIIGLISKLTDIIRNLG